MNDSEILELQEDYEVLGLPNKTICEKYNISESTLRRKVKKYNLERLSEIITSPDVKNSGILTPIILRKVKEIQEELGENYKSTNEVEVVMFAVNYQIWLDLAAKVLTNGTNTTSPKGVEYPSADFQSKKQVEKTLITLSNQLGLSITVEKKLGLKKPPPTKTLSLFDLRDRMEKVREEMKK